MCWGVRDKRRQEEEKVLIYYKNHKICIPNSLFFLKYLFLGMNFFLTSFLPSSRRVLSSFASDSFRRPSKQTLLGKGRVNDLFGRTFHLTEIRLAVSKPSSDSLSHFNYKF